MAAQPYVVPQQNLFGVQTPEPPLLPSGSRHVFEHATDRAYADDLAISEQQHVDRINYKQAKALLQNFEKESNLTEKIFKKLGIDHNYYEVPTQSRLQKYLQKMIDTANQKERMLSNKETLAKIQQIFKQDHYVPSQDFVDAIKRFNAKPNDKNYKALILMAGHEVYDHQQKLRFMIERKADEELHHLQLSLPQYPNVYAADIRNYFAKQEGMPFEERDYDYVNRFGAKKNPILDALQRAIRKGYIYETREDRDKAFKELGFLKASTSKMPYDRARYYESAFVDLC